MATSETGTENGVGNSARCKEFSARDENFILKSTHLFIYLSIYLFIYLFTYLFIYLFIIFQHV